MTLTLEHPLFTTQKQKYELWNDLYQGGSFMEAPDKAKTYLPRHPFETESQYKIRISRATYRNHAAPVVQVFSAAISAQPPDRDSLPEASQPIRKDVDREGTTAAQFFGDAYIKSAARGLHFILVDSPSGQAATRAEAREQGIRPYFVHAPSWTVMDWAWGKDGKLDWVKIWQEVELSADPLEGRTSQEQYKIWYRDRWEIWAEQEEEAGGKITKTDVKIEEGINPLNEIPLVPFYFEKASPFVGVSALDDVASLCRRVYMRDSELDKALFDSAVEVAVFLGFTEEELESFIRSSSNGLRSSETDASLLYAAPTGRAFEAIGKAINEDESRIREIALRMLRPESRQVESAESKKEDRKQLDSQLVRFAQNMESGENRCWELAMKWMQAGEMPDVLVYSKDFNEEEVSDALKNMYVDLRRNNDLSRETLWKILKSWGDLPEDFDAVEEAAQLEREGRTGRLNMDIFGGGRGGM